MKYLTDKFDLTMVALSKISMIRCKKIKKEDIPICEVIPMLEDDFTSKIIKNLFKISPHKNNIHIMIDENDIIYYVNYVGPKIEGDFGRISKLEFYEITVDYTECSKCSAKGTIDCGRCGKMEWISGEKYNC